MSSFITLFESAGKNCANYFLAAVMTFDFSLFFFPLISSIITDRRSQIRSVPMALRNQQMRPLRIVSRQVHCGRSVTPLNDDMLRMSHIKMHCKSMLHNIYTALYKYNCKALP